MNTVTYNRLRKIASESQITADMLYLDPFQYITGRHKPRKLVDKVDFSRLSDPDYVLANALGVPRNLFVHSAAQRITPKQAYTMAYTNSKAAERDWALSQAARKRVVQQLFGNDFVSSLSEDTVYPAVLPGSKLTRRESEKLKSRLLENFFARPTYEDNLTPVRDKGTMDTPYYWQFWKLTPRTIAAVEDLDNPLKYSGAARTVPGPRFIDHSDPQHLYLTPKSLRLHEVGGHAATSSAFAYADDVLAPAYERMISMLKNSRGDYGLLPSERLGGFHHLKAAYNSKYYPERLAEDNMDRAMEQLRDKKLLDSKTGLLTDEIFSDNGYSAHDSTVNSVIEVKQLPKHVPGVQEAQKQIDKDYAETMPIAKNSIDANTFRDSVVG